MGFWSGLFGGDRPTEHKITSLDLLQMLTGGRESGSGPVVNWKTALDVTTVLACCKVISEGVAQVPCKIYLADDKGRVEARDHPAYDLLYRQPNSWQTSFEFRETIMFHVLLTGAAYVWKGMVGSQRELRSLEPIMPSLMCVERDADGTLRYYVSMATGERREFPASDIWHIRGPSWNSWQGLESVRMAREAIGLSLALEASHAAQHKNGLKIPGTYSVEGPLTDVQQKQMVEWLKKASASGDTLVLDRGAKWLAQQMTGVDAQHVEVRQLQVEEVCRAFRVMPIMVGQADKAATYASVEQMLIAHVTHTLLPWYERLQQSADVNLLSDQDRAAGYYVELNPKALMQGAAKDRAEYYAKGLGAGGQAPWLTQDDVRGFEEMNPMGGNAAVLGTGAMSPAPGGTPNGTA